MTQISNRQRKRPIHRLQDHREPKVPTNNTSNEPKRTTRNPAISTRIRTARSAIEIRRRKQRKSDREAEQYTDETDIGAQRRDRIEETEDGHPDEEESKGVVEARGVGAVACNGVVEGCQGCAEGGPEAAEGEEDDGGEGVAEEPFADAAGVEQDAAAEEVGASVAGAVSM